MKTSFLRYIGIMAVVLLAAACSSSRHAGKSPMIGNLKGEEYIEKIIEYAPRWQAVTGKVAFDLNMGSKGSASLNATLRMKKGEVIQLSVAPLLGIEMARMEITPDRILAVDRLHKRYVEVSFEELGGMLQTDIDFNVLQSLFMNEIFLPGKPQLEAGDVRRFSVFSEGNQAVIIPKSSRNLSYRFFTGAESGLLEKTRVGLMGMDGYALEWEYGDFSKLDGKPFPRHIAARVTGKGYSLDMRLSRLSTNGDWESTSGLSSKYRKMELHELMELLIKK